METGSVQNKKMTQRPGSETARQRWADLMTALLLLAGLITAASRLTATHWTEDLGLVQSVLFLGWMAGIALGQSIFSKRVVGVFAFLYGAFVVPWQIGLTVRGNIDWNERLLSMLGRLQVILGDIAIRKAVEDNLLFLVLMAILFWVVSVSAAFILVRYGEPWRALLPAGLTAFVIDLFDQQLPHRSWYMAVYIFLGLIIIARMAFLHQRQAWQSRNAYIPQDIGFDVSRFAVLTALVVVLVAWNLFSINRALPGFSDAYQVFNTPYLQLKDKTSFLFASLRASFTQVIDAYGNFQTLGSGSLKSNQVIMTVDAPANPLPGVRYYWRARSYDIYLTGQWSASVVDSRTARPEDGNLSVAGLYGRKDMEFIFKPLLGVVTLFGAGQPLWYSRPGTIQYEPHSDGTIDLFSIKAEPYIRPGEQYRVRAMVGAFTQKQLREAGDTYPYWVANRYLQVPENITDRTRQLAKDITAQYDNPYDKAQAITNWLRANIKYQDLITLPPAKQEPLDWFLFDYRQGFCNYYASAEVIMLRTLGIPARWSVGYAQGTRKVSSSAPLPGQASSENPVYESATYVVTEKDAHAWPEVFFPNYGWVEFEPTVSQLAIDRPAGDTIASQATQEPIRPRETPLSEPEDRPVPTPRPFTPPPQKGITLGGLVALASTLAAGIILAIVVFARRRPGAFVGFWVWVVGGNRTMVDEWSAEGATVKEQLERTLAFMGQRITNKLSSLGIHPPAFLESWASNTLLPLIARAYQEVNNTLRSLGKKPEPGATPSERAAQVIRLIPEAKQPVEVLLSEYERASYSPAQPNIKEARQSAGALRALTRAVLVKKWISRGRG